MTITSVGYDGSVNEADWAYLSWLVGVDQAALDVTPSTGDFRVRIAGTGTRPVTVSPGRAFGSGVVDLNSADAILNPAALSSGTRWDTVVIERNWSTNTSSLQIRTGTSTKQVTRTYTTPGVREDQPLALILLDSSLSAVQQVIDLRAQADKVKSVATAEGLQLLTPYGWAYALDTGELWHAENVASVMTWVNSSVGTKIAFPLAGSPGQLLAFNIPPTYRKGAVDQRVQLEGTIKRAGTGALLVSSTATTDTIVGTLPPGFRPAAQRLFILPEIGGTDMCRCTVATTGVVSILTDGKDIVGVALDSLSFIADGN